MSDTIHRALPHVLRLKRLGHEPLGVEIESGMSLFTVRAEATGELAYALDYIAVQPEIVRMEARS